jgi:lipopolysaccharide biosynthesis regulator YciM
VAEEELADADVYRTYMVDYGAEVACRICGYKDALQVYYCSQCKRYYAYEPRHESALAITCPKGHKVPQEDH